MFPTLSDRSVFRGLSLALVMVSVVVPESASQGTELYLEAVNSGGHHMIVTRSTARNGVAVSLRPGAPLKLTFCVREKTIIQVREVLYSNDGQSETVAVAVDSTLLGTFLTPTQSDWGRLWNVFVPSPPMPRTLALYPGWHSLRVVTLLPSDGVELDSVRVWFSDAGLTKEMVECRLQCTPVPSLPAVSTPLWLEGTAGQESYPTQCAEEDNVKVPIYRAGISEYTVTASMPRYSKSASANRREPNTTHCAFLSHVLWTFDRLPRRPASRAQLLSLSVPGASLLVSSNSTPVFRVEFILQGRSEGHVDADIGSILTVKMVKSSAQIWIRCTYKGRLGRLRSLPKAVVNPGQTEHKLRFPDFTWRENDANLLLLKFYSSLDVHITQLTLERRPMKGETVHTVHWSPSLVVEAVEVDFWWRRPETMRLTNGESHKTWAKVDFFRISLSVPWNGGFAQVFVMYQDGNVRLAPRPPPGVDWIPFGSSVIVGHSDPINDLRPSAPIAAVTFHPATLRLNVKYRNGGSAVLMLSTTQTLTQLKVSNIHTGNVDSALPFATLRSMYITDGNSDCDSLLVDGTRYRPIMNRWRSVQGSSFFFFRRCESQHLTLSPDIRIDVIKTSRNPVTSGQRWWHLFSWGNQQTARHSSLATNAYRRIVSATSNQGAGVRYRTVKQK